MFGKVWTACCFKAKRVDRFLTFANSRYFDKPTYSQNLIATTQRYVSEVSLYVQNVMRKAWWIFSGTVCLYFSSPKTFQTSKAYRGCKITSCYFSELSCTRPSVYEISFCENFSLTGQTGGRKGVKNSTPTVHANFQDWKFHISYIARSKERKLCFVTRNVSETGLSFFKASKKKSAKLWPLPVISYEKMSNVSLGCSKPIESRSGRFRPIFNFSNFQKTHFFVVYL